MLNEYGKPIYVIARQGERDRALRIDLIDQIQRNESIVRENHTRANDEARKLTRCEIDHEAIDMAHLLAVLTDYMFTQSKIRSELLSLPTSSDGADVLRPLTSREIRQNRTSNEEPKRCPV